MITMKRQILALLATVLAGLAPAVAETAIGPLTLDPATTSVNRLTVTISATASGLTATDTRTTNVSGKIGVALDADFGTGSTSQFTISGGDLAMTDMSFNLRTGGWFPISVAKINTSGMAGTAYTASPPGAAIPAGGGGSFDASLHRLLINKGAITGEVTIPLQPVVPINTSFAESPVEGAGTGTGALTVTPTTQTQFQRFFTVVMSLPVDFTGNQDIDGTPVTIRVQGNIKASGTVAVPLGEEIAAWTFNTGSTSAARRAASGVAPGASVSALSFNASFTDVGPGAVPGGAHDGIGFGGNSGDSVLFLKRANYNDDSPVPDPRPTVESYTSWGPGNTAGPGSNLSANGNAPITFTVTADAVSTITIVSLTVDFTSGALVNFQLQAAGATPGGTAVTVSGAQNSKFTVPLPAPVIIGPGQARSFTINLDSRALNSASNIDGIALNGTVAYDHTYFWDGNGATAGYGTASGTWAAPTTGSATQGWSTSGAGGIVPATVTTGTTNSLNFGNGANGLAAGTIAVAGAVDCGNMTFASGSGAITLAGGTIHLADASTITVHNSQNTIASAISGAAVSLTKAGGGTLTLAGANHYTGATIISGGTLALGADNTLPGSSHVAIGAAVLDGATFANTAGTLDVTAAATIRLGSGGSLAFAGSSTLNWSGTLAVSGDFVAGASLRFGTSRDGLTPTQLGLITVNGSAGPFELDANGYLIAAPTGFAAWQTANGGTTGGINADHDNDSVPNGIEYFLGGATDTSGFTPLPGVTATGGALSVTWTMAADYAGEYGSHFVVETSDTLAAESWHPVAESLTPAVADTVHIAGRNVTYTFPPGAGKFARLVVTGP
jgi:autotransporter-associated beta strand protein